MSQQTRRIYEFGPFQLDADEGELRRAGQVVHLKPKVLETLVVLVECGGRVVGKEELMSRLWPDSFVEEANLAVNVSQLRKALGDDAAYIETVPKRGYRFAAEVRESGATQAGLVVRERTRAHIVIDEQEDGDQEEAGAVLNAASAGVVSGLAPTAEAARALALTVPAAARRSRAKRVAAVAAALAGALALAAFGIYEYARHRSSSFERMQITRLTTFGRMGWAAISPDGKYVAYAKGMLGQQESLWVRQVGTDADVQIVAPADVDYGDICFSRDGNYIYYSTSPKGAGQTALYQIPVLGGAPKKLLADCGGTFAPSWDGRKFVFVIYDPAKNESLLMLANADGSGERVLAARKAPNTFNEPAWSPDDTLIACGAWNVDAGGTYANVVTVRVADGAEAPLGSRRWGWIGQTEWLADGSAIIFTGAEHAGGFYAQQIWELSYPSGSARRITNDINGYIGIRMTADSESLVTERIDLAASVWVAPLADTSRADRISAELAEGYKGVAWTPDGRMVFARKVRSDSEIWIMNPDGSGRRQLTVDGEMNILPAVTPDGRYIVFSSYRTGKYTLWRMNLDGGDVKQLTAEGTDSDVSFSPDSRWVYFTRVNALHAETANGNIWRVSIDGGEPVQLTQSPSSNLAVSPDGASIACGYWDRRLGPLPKLAVIRADGGEPLKTFDLPQGVTREITVRWTPDGHSLIYSAWGGSKIWLQPLGGGPPKVLADFKSEQVWSIDLSRDGRQLAYSLGTWTLDAVLISHFR